jgi:hypothetical protein
MKRWARRGFARAGVGGLLSGVGAAMVLLAGCGTATVPSSALSASSARTCGEVTAILSDGPDPGADPVGYAEAQVLPLRAVRTPDARLGADVRALASSYELEFRTDGRAGARSVAHSFRRVERLCPGVVQ